MDHTLFCNSFIFRTILLRSAKHTDNANGIPRHFLARMRTGTGVLCMLDGSQLHLKAGDAFYLPLGLQYHSYWTPSPNGEKTVSWDSYGFTYLPTPASVQYEAQILMPSKQTDTLFQALAQNQSVTPISVGNLYLLFGTATQTMKQKNENPKDLLFDEIKQYLFDHPQCKIPELAKYFSISESGLYKFVREHGHTTPINLKNHIQTQKAIRLLTTTNLSVEEISEQLGFCSSIYFRKIFKRETGQTPSVLRQKHEQKHFI